MYDIFIKTHTEAALKAGLGWEHGRENHVHYFYFRDDPLLIGKNKRLDNVLELVVGYSDHTLTFLRPPIKFTLNQRAELAAS